MIEFPPALRIQATIVRSKAAATARALKYLDDFSGLPCVVLTKDHMEAVRSALIFALSVLEVYDEQSEQTT